jgi:serine/threonine protein kinase
VTVRTGALIAGRYRVERQIGSGGMGVVWRAADERLDRTVAIKRAHPGADARHLRRLVREARLAGGVDHPRVVKLLDLVVEDAATWLVMEYVPSRNLAEVISDGVLPPERVARIGRQIADALEAVHSRGIVHGDVTPGNILITDDGDAKLTDFGVARAVWGDETVSDSGLVHGTPAYLAPEVARGGEPLPASDVFSLGATLFAAAEGVSPLGTGDNPLTVIWRSSSGHVAAPHVPGPLGGALSAMLRVDPSDRPDAASVKGLLCAGDATVPLTSSRRFGRWIALGAVALVATVVAASLSSSSGSPPAQSVEPRVPAIGDPRGAEPCSLMSASVLHGFGDTELSTDYGNFNRCDVLVQRDGDDLADVKVELENGPAPEAGSRDRVETHGTVRIVSEPAVDDECDRTLIPSGAGFVAVTAQRTGNGHIDLCAAATAVSTYAANVLGRGTMPRRVTPQPPTSLANLNACALLPGSALSRAGIDADRPEAGFGGWDCRWAGATTDLQLRFDRNSPLDSGDGHPRLLGGHHAFVQSGGDGPGTCLVQVVHRTYTDMSEDRVSEIVYLVLSGGKQLCGKAEGLASAAAAHLPPA